MILPSVNKIFDLAKFLFKAFFFTFASIDLCLHQLSTIFLRKNPAVTILIAAFNFVSL